MQIINVSNSSEKLMLTMVNRLRRLFRNVLRTTKLPSVITSSDVPESVDYVYLGSMVGRKRRAQQSNQPRCKHSSHPYSQRHLHREKTEELRGMSEPINHQPAKSRANQTPCQRQSDRFTHEESEHAALGESQRLQHSHLPRALADR